MKARYSFALLTIVDLAQCLTRGGHLLFVGRMTTWMNKQMGKSRQNNPEFQEAAKEIKLRKIIEGFVSRIHVTLTS